MVLAFNNPTGNPTTGGGVIGVDTGALANSLYIDSLSNVGIGTTNPGAKLDVTGAAQFGTGNVNLIDSTGKITGLSSTYFASLDGSTLTGLNASSLGSGTVAPGRVSGSYTGITGVGTLTAGAWNANTIGTSYGGTGATAAANTANGVVVLNASAYLPGASVDTSALKTATGEVTRAAGSGSNMILPGGEYGFYPQFKGYPNSNWGSQLAVGGNFGSYTTIMFLYADAAGAVYARQRYVTASGQDNWIFLLIDKITKEIISVYQAPDHPAYGNGGDFDKLPHPFVNYDPSTQEIILIEKDQAKNIQKEAQEKKIGVLELTDSEYKIDFEHTYDYKPIHSGQFLETQPVLVEHIPDYVQVRKFVEMTDVDKQAKKSLQEEKQRQAEQEKQLKEQKHQDTVNKLKNLGLTEEDLKEIIK